MATGFQKFDDVMFKIFQKAGGTLFERLDICEVCRAEKKRSAGIDPRTNEAYDRVFCNCELLPDIEKALVFYDSIPERKANDFFQEFSFMNKKLETAEMENFIADHEKQKEAKAATEIFLNILLDDSRREKENLLISGDIGIGKSHLAAAACKEVMKRGKKALFIRLPDLFLYLQSTFNKNSNVAEIDLLKKMMEVELLVLDELGSEHQTGWTEQRLLQVIDSRQGKATFYTTNFTGKQLEAILDPRTMDRVLSDTFTMRMEGVSRRKRVERKLNF